MKNNDIGSTSSSSLDYQRSLLPGYRFKPTDRELLLVYLQHKIEHGVALIPDIQDVDLYKSDPQMLTEKYPPIGDREWYFFTPRDRKYRSSNRPNRCVSTGGYWKAVATDIEVMDQGKVIGRKRNLLFNYGTPKDFVRTKWMMHEYIATRRPWTTTNSNANDTKLDDWVLCRLYEKERKGKGEQQHVIVDDHISEQNSELIDLTIHNNFTLPQFCTNERDDDVLSSMMVGEDLSLNNPPLNNSNLDWDILSPFLDNVQQLYNNAPLSMDHILPAASPHWSTITHANHIDYLHDVVLGRAFENNANLIKENRQEVVDDNVEAVEEMNVDRIYDDNNMYDPKFYNGSGFMKIGEDGSLNTPYWPLHEFEFPNF